MWIRLIDDSNPSTPRVFEYAEGVLSTCDYRIHNNGKANITLHKDGYEPSLNLESAMFELMSKDYFHAELYSGSVIVKAVKCKVSSYSMGSGETGNLRERAELSILVEGIDYEFTTPVISEAIYDVVKKTLTVIASNLIQDGNGAYRFNPTRMSLFGVVLTSSSVVKTAQRNSFAIQISESDATDIENARKIGAEMTLRTLLGWNTEKAKGSETALIVVDMLKNTQEIVESGSTDGLSG